MCCAVRTLEQPSAKRGIKVQLNKTSPTGPREAGVVTAPALTHTTQHTPHYYHHHHHHSATDCSADKGRTDTTHYNNTGALQTTQPSTYRILLAQASCRGGPGPHVFFLQNLQPPIDIHVRKSCRSIYDCTLSRRFDKLDIMMHESPHTHTHTCYARLSRLSRFHACSEIRQHFIAEPPLRAWPSPSPPRCAEWNGPP